jgi:hypothetical protein
VGAVSNAPTNRRQLGAGRVKEVGHIWIGAPSRLLPRVTRKWVDGVTSNFDGIIVRAREEKRSDATEPYSIIEICLGYNE